MRTLYASVFCWFACSGFTDAAEPDKRFPLFTALTSSPPPTLVTYTPSELDPRAEVNQRRLKTSSIRADLTALRPAFDGLVLYGYHEATTPRILSIAKDLKYQVILLAIWDIKSGAEIDGIVDVARLHSEDFALGVLVGNEGITFNRYEAEDLAIAASRLRKKLPATIPIGTSEPLVGYQHAFIREFGDFLAPNIHPVFDQPKLDPKKAALWAREQTALLAKKTQKPVILKETGFPHAGKEMYTPESQQAFWSAYTESGLLVQERDSSKVWQFHGVGFEAFDLPWKSQESKLEIEKSWGLLSPKREVYPAFNVWKTLRK